MMLKISQNFQNYWIPAIIWTLVILAVSTLPGNAIAPASNIQYLSVFAHFSEYLVFSFLLHRALANEKISARNALAITIVASFAYSVLTEILQLYVPGRFFDYNDILTNDLGALAGLARGIYTLAA